MIGETYFHQKDYEPAVGDYLRVESLYAFPRWQAAALLQAAKCYELQGKRAEAERLYAQLIKDYPDTEYAAGATERLNVDPAQSGDAAMLGGGGTSSRNLIRSGTCGHLMGATEWLG